MPITVRENLSWQEMSRIEVNAPDLPGINIDVGQSRYYPNGPIAAHVMGYVSAVSEKDLTGDPLLELLDSGSVRMAWKGNTTSLWARRATAKSKSTQLVG